MSFPTLPAILRNAIRLCTVLGLTATAALPDDLCPGDMGAPQFQNTPETRKLCAGLWPRVRTPSDANGVPRPLNEYEADVGQFFNNFCYRDPSLVNANGTGWAVDKGVRDTGPFVAYRNADNKWETDDHGFHAPVVIWYSPDMIEWIRKNRPETGAPADPEPVPDGVIIVKEMYTPPASRCAGRDLKDLKPSNGIAYMIRDSKASQDGWFWGYFGFFDPSKPDPNIDWPARPGNALPYAGFGQYCLNCHASAANNSTFSSLSNIAGEPGEPLVFLSMDWMLSEIQSDIPEHVPQDRPQFTPIPNSTPLTRDQVPAGFADIYNLKDGASPLPVSQFTLPSQTYDNVWPLPGDTPPLQSEYLTSDQCLGCHDAGSTGLAFDMTQPNPHGDDLINLSPYATWRSSPMGLAGRDPIFFGQLSSEEEFHKDYVPLIWNTCLGCHGIMGQRQFQLDQVLDDKAGKACSQAVFNPSWVAAIPYDPGTSRAAYSDADEPAKPDPMTPHFDPVHAKYGALARDGISCVACHRTALTPQQTMQFQDQTQNDCVTARQDLLNVGIGGLSGFGKTFTGSFLVSDPATLYGPFGNPRTMPMDHALGNIPEHDNAIASSEQCGTCHTVHLPVLWPKKNPDDPDELNVIGNTYEQTTYPEWLFSQYRTGTAAFLNEGEMLPHGPGATPVSCAGCHLESRDENGPFRSRIASIQQKTNMPQAEHTLPAAEIDLPQRDGFARHTLVGLNLFLVKMAQQFPDVLGIPLEDPMLVGNGMAGLQRTELEMVENARHRTADISIESRRYSDDTGLTVDVRVDNLAGHKFPSGVSFRRAFVEFEVMDNAGDVIWHSGATDDYGVLIDAASKKPLKGELWYDRMCHKIVGKDDFQPHYTEIVDPTQVQIYQEVKLDPGDPAVETGENPSCAEDARVLPSANLTTSFLSICHTPKDNRLLPAGLLGLDQRAEIAEKLGLVRDGEAEKLAIETGAQGIGEKDGGTPDPDYSDGRGGDTITYRVADIGALGSGPYSVRATLHYQATPPFFLQDRFCTGEGANRDRLYHISQLLDTKGTPIEDWKFRLVSTGVVPVSE